MPSGVAPQRHTIRAQSCAGRTTEAGIRLTDSK